MKGFFNHFVNTTNMLHSLGKAFIGKEFVCSTLQISVLASIGNTDYWPLQTVLVPFLFAAFAYLLTDGKDQIEGRANWAWFWGALGRFVFLLPIIGLFCLYYYLVLPWRAARAILARVAHKQ